MKLLVVTSALVLGAVIAVERAPVALAAPPKGLMGEAGLAPRFGASADPSASDKETARALYEQGDKAFKEKKFADARKAFEGAYALVPVPSTGAALARTLAEVGALVEARDVYLAVQRMPATKGEPAPFTKARKEATEQGKTLAARIPTLRLSIEGAPASTPLQVFFDGDEVPAVAATLPRKVNPGRHAIVVKAPGYVDQVVTATVGEGGTTELSVSLTKAGNAVAGGVGVVCPASTLWDEVERPGLRAERAPHRAARSDEDRRRSDVSEWHRPRGGRDLQHGIGRSRRRRAPGAPGDGLCILHGSHRGHGRRVREVRGERKVRRGGHGPGVQRELAAESPGQLRRGEAGLGVLRERRQAPPLGGGVGARGARGRRSQVPVGRRDPLRAGVLAAREIRRHV
jgi:hypothetical protein